MKDRERDKFEADELAVVLSHYDLGTIESITEFTRGSRRSPKVGIVCERGKFLLKRRDPERTKLGKIRFAHRLQAFLAGNGFPLPRVIHPRGAEDDEEGVLVLRDRIYELFDYVAGHSYRGSEGETHDAGRVLGTFHGIARSFDPGADAPTGDYHDSNIVRTGLSSLPQSVSPHESVMGQQAELLGLVNCLYDAYEEAARAANDARIGEMPEQVVHSDWHPGNMLFRNDKVAAVIDYDSARLARRILDVANGVLQFSMLSGGSPETWPDHLDENQSKRFLAGYEEAESLSEAERRCIPHLMLEAIVAESVVPIAMTGSFGHWHGFRFMKMVRRKVTWLREHTPQLTEALQQ